MNEAALSLKDRFRPSRFLRGEQPVDHTITLSHRRIFILPTGRGLGFVLLVTLLLLIAFVYNNNLAYLLTFMLASVFFVTILHSFKALAGLMIKPGHAQSGFAGQSVGFALHLYNPQLQPRMEIGVKLDGEMHLSMDAQERKSIVLYTDALRRGWQTCGVVTLSSCYPLGLFRAWSPMRFNLKALVYPKPSKIELPFPESSGSRGEQGQGKMGQEDFYGIKSYQHGDPIRMIHWKAFAKGQGLYSKEYSGAVSREFWLEYEATPGNDVEERLSQLCRWIIDAENAGMRYGLALPGRDIPPAHGRQHYEECLKALALF